MGLLDEGETDWKILAIDVNDPMASKLNDVEDIERHLPGLIRATNEWFRIYKVGSIFAPLVFDTNQETRGAEQLIHSNSPCSDPRR